MISIDGQHIENSIKANFLQAIKGYMFSKDTYPSMILFSTYFRRASIHTYFCYFNLSLYFINKEGFVFSSAENILPGTFMRLSHRSLKYFLEIPSESPLNKMIKIGSHVCIN